MSLATAAHTTMSTISKIATSRLLVQAPPQLTYRRCCTRPAPMCASSYETLQFDLAHHRIQREEAYGKKFATRNQVWVPASDPDWSLTSRSYSATFPHRSGSKLSAVIWVPLRLGTLRRGSSTKSRLCLAMKSPMQKYATVWFSSLFESRREAP